MNNTPEELLILFAAATGNIQILKQFAESDEEGFRAKCEGIMDSEGFTVLHLATAAGKTKMCKYLVENVKMNINRKTDAGETPLFLAMMGVRLPAAAYIIQHGADVNMRNAEGLTPLHYAAAEGHAEIVQLLITHGADIEAMHKYGKPIHAAVSHGKTEAVRILLENNANPNSASPLSIAPVMLAIKAHSVECLDMLLKAGADPNIGTSGLTPLTCAADPGTRSSSLAPLACSALEVETQYIELLLKAGANPDLTSITGLTPIEHAALACNRAGVMILFPVTSRIPYIPDWSFDGIMSYVHSDEGEEQRELKRKENFLLAKKRGEAAVKRKDYVNAVGCYTEANFLCQTCAAVLSNMSLCWANLKEGKFALRDAEKCVQLRPDWPKAYYREGVAWKLLKNYCRASEAFAQALSLDPENKEIQKALEETVQTWRLNSVSR